jgi:hypothetical protein
MRRVMRAILIRGTTIAAIIDGFIDPLEIDPASAVGWLVSELVDKTGVAVSIELEAWPPVGAVVVSPRKVWLIADWTLLNVSRYNSC